MAILTGKTGFIFGVANDRSYAFFIAQAMIAHGATCIFSHIPGEKNERRTRKAVEALGISDPILISCDAGSDADLDAAFATYAQRAKRMDFLIHSIAFADYSGEPQPFHATAKRDFLRAFDISCFSLVAVSNALKDLLARDASVVTISISTTQMASENYGYMAPIKAALDSSLAFLAKSFSRFSQVRFNAVAPGLLKTSASAGIPGYVDSYLYAEQATLRKEAVRTDEVANVAAFLLSPRSSGLNSQWIVIDAGMSTNYFDAALVKAVLGGAPPSG